MGILRDEGIFKRAQDIILQCGTLKQYSSYITNSITFCGSLQIVCVSPTVSQALHFLVELFHNGIGSVV